MKHNYDAITALSKQSTGKWDGVTFINDVTVNYFNGINKTSHRLQITRDIARPNFPVFFFNKNSILTSIFTRKIGRCDESGLIPFWISQYTRKHKRDKHREPKTLGIFGIMAMLQITIVMYLISFIVFLMEILSLTHARIRKFLDFLTY